MKHQGQIFIDRRTAAETIRQMGEDDLRFLNRLIVERIKLIHQARSTAQLAQFSVGDRVSFEASCGHRMAGVIIRLNKKTASIKTDDGHHWNVAPSFLSHVKPSGNHQLQQPRLG